MNPIVTIMLDCGMTLVVEPIPSVASVALNWLLPAGSASDPVDGDGYAAMLSEMIQRGAGQLNSREHSDALDRLGVQRGADVQRHHMRIDAITVGDRFMDSLPLLVDMVRAPMMPADAIEPVRSLCLQALESLNDEPQHMVMLRLGEHHYPAPFNRHGYGEANVLETATIDDLREVWSKRFRPRESIMGVAGAVDPQKLASRLNQLLQGWQGEAPQAKALGPAKRGYTHIEQTTAQVHIGLGYEAPRERDATSMIERLGIGVLSGSTSGRLFSEVRQKRSLCYSVGASYRAGRDSGMISLYAGTTPERAQETLDVCLEEIVRMKSGVTQAEFHRAVIGLKSHLIMQGESTHARAGALVYDQYRIGRARTLDEVAHQIDAISINHLNEYLANRGLGEQTIISIGPAPLQMKKENLSGTSVSPV